MKIERTRIHVFSSLRASPPIWASETSLAPERRRSPNRRACSQATFSATFSLLSPSSDLEVPNDCRTARKAFPCCVDVVVNFLSQLIFIFPLVMYGIYGYVC